MPFLSRPFATQSFTSVGIVALALAFPPDVAAQRTRTLTACTPDVLAVCAELRLSAGPSVFELAIRTLSATGAPGLPLSVYNLVLGTGAAPATAPFGVPVVPLAEGGAIVSDASPWDVFDSGDALFLSALTNRGIGGCATGPDVGGFGQAVTTCGAGQFAVFRFAPTILFDPNAFTILNLEAVGLSSGLPTASCGATGATCVITADTRPRVPEPVVVPEPMPVALLGAGLLLTAAATNRRRVA